MLRFSPFIEKRFLCHLWAGVWPFQFKAALVSVCDRFGLWPLRPAAVFVCGRFGLCLICARFSVSLFRLWPSQHVAATNCYHLPTLTFSYDIVHMLFLISHEWQFVPCLLKVVAALIVIVELYSEWYILPNCKYCPAWNVSVISNNRTPFLAFLILLICHNIIQR